MRGIEKIAAQITGEAEEKKVAIEKEIQKQTAAIDAAADAEIKAELERIKDETAKEEKKLEELAALAAQQRKRQSALLTKQEVIGNIIKQAYENLLALDDDRYFEIIKQMLEDYVLAEKGEIIFSKKDRERMPEGFAGIISEIAASKGGQLVMSDEIRDIDGGFVLVYGGIEENCTFRAIMEADREELYDMVNGKLFG